MVRPTVHELLPVLRPAQVLCVARAGFTGWLIRRVTGYPQGYSHVALVDRTASDIAIVVEATGAHGVAAARLERYLEDPSVIRLLLRDATDLSPEERGRIMASAWLEVGKGYDGLQLLGIYLRRRLPWLFGGRRRALRANPFDSEGRRICSELVTLAYWNGAYFNLTPGLVSIGNVDPNHLAQSYKLSTVWSWEAA